MHEWSTVGNILTKESRSTWRKIWTGLGLKLGLQDERSATTAFVLARLKIDFIPHGEHTSSAG